MAIKCGKCKDSHPDVATVRACYYPPAYKAFTDEDGGAFVLDPEGKVYATYYASPTAEAEAHDMAFYMNDPEAWSEIWSGPWTREDEMALEFGR